MKTMYQTLCMVAMCLFSLAANAQEVTVKEMSDIKPGSKINYILDFSEASIMGMNEKDFSNYESDWQKDKPTISGRFQKGVNNRLGGVLTFGYYTDSPYTMKVKVKTVTDVGNIYCDAVITNKEGKVLFSVKNVNGGAEPPLLPGTKLAKMKIWAQITGRVLGGIIKSEYLSQ